MRHEDGRWLIRFSSILVNIGKGDFALRAKRAGDDWQVEQDVYYSTNGAEKIPTPARLIWGGGSTEPTWYEGPERAPRHMYADARWATAGQARRTGLRPAARAACHCA